MNTDQILAFGTLLFLFAIFLYNLKKSKEDACTRMASHKRIKEKLSQMNTTVYRKSKNYGRDNVELPRYMGRDGKVHTDYMSNRHKYPGYD